MICVNTHIANYLVKEAIEKILLANYVVISRSVQMSVMGKKRVKLIWFWKMTVARLVLLK